MIKIEIPIIKTVTSYFRFCCNHRPNEVIRSEGNYVMILFRSNFDTSSHVIKRGFQLSYYSGSYTNFLIGQIYKGLIFTVSLEIYNRSLI